MSKQIKGLGKGLDAIFQSSGMSPAAARSAIKSNDSTVTEIPISKIEVNPNQPRTLFDQDAIQELATSISRLGIIQPITLRVQGDGYMIISGERRFRASQIADLKSVPAYVRRANDQELFEMALIENIQREDLNAIEIALSFDRLLKECEITQEELANRIGKKRSTIANYLRLLSLAAEVQASVRENLVSMGHARALASLSNHSDQVYVLEQILEKSYSVRETEELVAKMSQEKKPNALRTAVPSQFKTIKNELSELFNQKVSISQGRGGVGKVSISFTSEEELEQIREIILKNQSH